MWQDQDAKVIDLFLPLQLMVFLHMESDFQVTVKGLGEERAREIGNLVIEAIRYFEKCDEQLDLRRMHRIILTTDFGKEMEQLSKLTLSKNPIKYTQEGGNVAIAKVLTLPKEDDFEILLVFNADVLSAYFPGGDGAFKNEAFRSALHYLHHELCHIHDENTHLDAFRGVWMTTCYEGRDTIIRPLATRCWGEYFACRVSSSTVQDNIIGESSDRFKSALLETKPIIDQAILSYRHHADMNRLMDALLPIAYLLPTLAAYMIGYLDGIETSLSSIFPEVEESLSGSYFETIWPAMHETLDKMFNLYPEDWKDIGIYDDLAVVIDKYFEALGFLISNKDGGIYVRVPF